MDMLPKETAGRILVGTGAALFVAALATLIWSLFQPPVTNGPMPEIPGYESK